MSPPRFAEFKKNAPGRGAYPPNMSVCCASHKSIAKSDTDVSATVPIFVGLAMTPVIQRSPSPGIDENTRSRSHRLGVSPARLYRYIPVARTAITPIG
jgi:hypothetical protein